MLLPEGSSLVSEQSSTLKKFPWGRSGLTLASPQCWADRFPRGAWVSVNALMDPKWDWGHSLYLYKTQLSTVFRTLIPFFFYFILQTHYLF